MNSIRLLFADKPSAKQIRRIIDKALGMPVAPVNVGDGPWNPSAPGADRWTRITKKRGQGVWCIHIDPGSADILSNATKKGPLSAQNIADLTAAMASQEPWTDQNLPDDDDVDDPTP
jgi:hypothetical protein